MTFKFEIVNEIPGVSEIICNTGGDAPLNTFAVTSTFEELEPKLILSANSWRIVDVLAPAGTVAIKVLPSIFIWIVSPAFKEALAVNVMLSICWTANWPPEILFSNSMVGLTGIIIDPSLPPKHVTSITSLFWMKFWFTTGLEATWIIPLNVFDSWHVNGLSIITL